MKTGDSVYHELGGIGIILATICEDCDGTECNVNYWHVIFDNDPQQIPTVVSGSRLAPANEPSRICIHKEKHFQQCNKA